MKVINVTQQVRGRTQVLSELRVATDSVVNLGCISSRKCIEPRESRM